MTNHRNPRPHLSALLAALGCAAASLAHAAPLDVTPDTLIERATEVGIEAIVLSPAMEDFNDDLHHLGLAAFRASIADQLMRRDRFAI